MLLWKNNAYSSLAAGISAAATTLTVASGQGDRFPEVIAPDFALLTLQDASNNIEIVRVTARAGGSDSMTIVRAQEGTTARAWALGDVVEGRITQFGLNPLQVLAGAATAAAIRDALLIPTRTGGDASGTWAISITGNAANVTGIVAPVNGGTGLTSYAVGDLLYASSTSALARLVAAATGNVLLSGSTPSWGKVGLTTHVDGILGVPNGGTGAASFTSGGLLRGNGTGALSVASAADIVAAIGATNVTNATNVTGTVASGATGTTQAARTSNTTLATTAFVDRLRSLLDSISPANTLEISDRGSMKDISADTTVPANVFARTDVVTLLNNSATPRSLIQGSGLTMRQAGTSNTGNRTMGAYAIVTIVFESATACRVSGAGLT